MQQVILSDENCGKHAEIIFHALERLDYVDLLGLVLKKFDEVGLAMDTDDETVWRFCQEKGYLLVTGNRSAKDGSVSLELTVRRLVTNMSLPVLTIGDLERVLADREYCERCAERMAEIIIDLEGYRGGDTLVSDVVTLQFKPKRPQALIAWGLFCAHLRDMDLSKDMLSEARKKNVYTALHQEMMGTALGFPDALFDAVISIGVE